FDMRKPMRPGRGVGKGLPHGLPGRGHIFLDHVTCGRLVDEIEADRPEFMHGEIAHRPLPRACACSLAGRGAGSPSYPARFSLVSTVRTVGICRKQAAR